MIVIKNGDEKVTRIINKKAVKEDAVYRLSRHIYPYSFNGRHLIVNMMSYEVIELTEQEWDAVMKMKDTAVSISHIRAHGLEQLVLSRYIVEDSHDEIKQYQQTVFLLKTMSGGKKGLSTYTVFPTTGCNARCTYCYEEGYTVKTMTVDTADKLVDFICKTRYNDIIKLRWFGGEPLVNADIIRHICSALSERGVPYTSSMITNASLVTKELAHEARELWKLEKVQVSVDGAKEDYEKRKRYVSPQKYNYESLMQAIHFLADEGIKVSLRCNYDKENIPGLKSMIDDLEKEFGGMKNVSVYFHILYQENFKDDYVSQLKAIDDICEYAEEKGLTQENGLRQGFRANNCMADSMDNTIVISPDGTFFNCEHLPEGATWGNIFDGVTDKEKYNELKAVRPLEKECAECCFLSLCTSFRKKNCPDTPKYCREEKQVKIERYLRSLIRKTDKNNDNKKV
jgi:radical SAM protein with 4Fe4S-binding SPASM domain